MGRSKSPGPDGLPIEFYELLMTPGHHEDVLIKWLQAVYRHSYRSGILPKQMRKSQIKLLYKKDSEEDKKIPQKL